VTLQHVRREHNKRTDQLCNDALDGKREASAEALIAASLDGEAIACLRAAGAGPDRRRCGRRSSRCWRSTGSGCRGRRRPEAPACIMGDGIRNRLCEVDPLSRPKSSDPSL